MAVSVKTWPAWPLTDLFSYVSSEEFSEESDDEASQESRSDSEELWARFEINDGPNDIPPTMPIRSSLSLSFKLWHLVALGTSVQISLDFTFGPPLLFSGARPMPPLHLALNALRLRETTHTLYRW